MRLNRYSFSPLGCLAAVILSVNILNTNAQTYDPPPQVMNYPAFYSNKTSFFIQGGLNINNEASNQFYLLDLSVDWTTEKPAWRDLKSLGSPPVAFAGGLLPGGGIVSLAQYFEIGVRYTMVSNSGSSSWSPVIPPSANNFVHVVSIVTTPTGAIFYGNLDQMFMLNLTNNMSPVQKLPMHLRNGASTWTSAYAWTDAVGKGAIISLARIAGQGPPKIEILEMGSIVWQSLTTSGEYPDPWGTPCFVTGVDGDKMYYFGGVGFSSLRGYLYELDLKNNTWRRFGTETYPRDRAACVATKHLFIVWGGFTSNTPRISVLADSTPLVFDFATEKWINKYTAESTLPPPPSPLPPPPPPPPPPPLPQPSDPPSNPKSNDPGPKNSTSGGNNNRNSKGSDPPEQPPEESQLNIAAIAGGTAGAVALVATFALIFFVRRHSRKEQEYDDLAYSLSKENTSRRVHRHDPSPNEIERDPGSWNESRSLFHDEMEQSAMFAHEKTNPAPLSYKRQDRHHRQVFRAEQDYRAERNYRVGQVHQTGQYYGVGQDYQTEQHYQNMHDPNLNNRWIEMTPHVQDPGYDYRAHDITEDLSKDQVQDVTPGNRLGNHPQRAAIQSPQRISEDPQRWNPQPGDHQYQWTSGVPSAPWVPQPDYLQSFQPHEASMPLQPYEASVPLQPYEASMPLQPYEASMPLQPYEASLPLRPRYEYMNHSDSRWDTSPPEDTQYNFIQP